MPDLDPVWGLPAPTLGEAPNAPEQIGDLRDGVAGLLQPYPCTSSTRPAHRPGFMIYETDTQRVRVSDGTSWRFVSGPDESAEVTYGTGWTYTSTAAVTPVVTLHGEWATIQGAARRESGTSEIALTVPEGFRPSMTVTWGLFALNSGNALARPFRGTYFTDGTLQIAGPTGGTGLPAWDANTWFTIFGTWPVDR